MPYITQSQRKKIDETPISRVSISSPGELNYAISTLCARFINEYGVSYTDINSVIGALECAKQEFYRRVASPYEDEKAKVNGDIYPLG